MLRLTFVSLLVLAGVLLRMLDLASLWSLSVERVFARTLVLALTAAVLFCARSVLRPWWVQREQKARLGLQTVLGGSGFFVLMLFASGALRITGAETAGAIRIIDAYGPLTVWPTLQWTSAMPPVLVHLSLGHALLFAATSLVMAATMVRLVVRDDPDAPGGPRSLLGVFPLGLAPGACPACAPVLLSLGGAALAPAAGGLADPLGPLATLLDLVAPAAALAALLLVTRPHATAYPRPLRTVHRLAAAATVGVLALPVAAAIGGMPHGAAQRQDATYELFVLVTIGALVLTLLVFIVLLGFAYRYRARDTDADTDPADWTMRSGVRTPLIIGFFLVPILVIFGLGALSFDVLSSMEDIPEDPVYVEVVSTQFSWRFQHEDGTLWLDELHIEQDQVVVLNLTSADVVHSLFVPDLGVKMDAMPGTTTQVWMQAQQTGTYAAYCAEWCGAGHPEMRAQVFVHAPGEAPDAPSGGRGG